MASADEEDKKGGEVVFAGYASWSLVGKNGKTGDFDGVEEQILWDFRRLNPLVGVKVSKVVSGPVACTCVALAASGACYVWGRNSHGQLGLGHNTNVYNPTMVEIPNGESVAGGACGPNHTLLFSATGSLFAAGNGKSGQLGIGRKVDSLKKFTTVSINSVVTAVAAGREFSMVVDSNGVIYSFGHPEHGCLGNGSESKILERSNKFTFECVSSPTPIVALPRTYGPDVKIVDVACGAKHTCAMDSQGRIYTWGYGAYGRLGHKDNKNQMEPVAVELFSFEPPPLRDDVPKFMQRQQPKVRATQITCGGTATFVVAGEPHNSLYMFGITKKSGEASLYPTLVKNVEGWRVRSVSVGNTSVAVASERSLITWGPSPTFGELGYGEDKPKSSTVSNEVEYIKGSLTLQVASGMAHTLAIIDMDDEVSKSKVEELRVFSPEEVNPAVAKAKAAKATADRKAKRDSAKAKKNNAGRNDAEDGEDDGLGENNGDDDEEGEDEAYDDDEAAKDEDEEDDDDEDEEEEKPAPKRKAASKAKSGRGRPAPKKKAKKSRAR